MARVYLGSRRVVAGYLNGDQVLNLADPVGQIDVAPTVNLAMGTIPENSPAGTVMGQVSATGFPVPDLVLSGPLAGIAILNGNDIVQTATAEGLNHEGTGSYDGTVTATNSVGVASVTGTLIIDDVTEIVLVSSPILNSLIEGQNPSYTRGSFIDDDNTAIPAGSVSLYGYNVNGAYVPGALSGAVEGDTVQAAFRVLHKGELSPLFLSNTITVQAQGSLPDTAWGPDLSLVGSAAPTYVVSPTGDNTTGDGSMGAPFATVSHAASLAQPGDYIGLMGGTYREQVNLVGGVSGNPVTYGPVAGEVPVIKASDVLAGSVALVAADADVVGPNWGFMRKVSVPFLNLPGGDPRALKLIENDTPMVQAVEQVGNPVAPGHQDGPLDWLIADEMITEVRQVLINDVLTDQTFIIGMRVNQALLDKYSDAQWLAMDVGYQGSPNIGKRSAIEAVDRATRIVTFVEKDDQPSASDYTDRFILINALQNIKPGMYGYTTSGGLATVYFWRLDAFSEANGQLEITARENILRPTSHVVVEGLGLANSASYNDRADLGDYAFAETSVAVKKNGITLRHCHIKNTWRGKRDQGPIWIRNCDDLTIERNLIENAFSQFGMVLDGGTSSNTGFGEGTPQRTWSWRLLVRQNILRNVSNSAFRLRGIRDGAVLYNQVFGSAFEAHANDSSAYNGCHNVIFGFNYFHNGNGYLAFHASSLIHMIGNYDVTTAGEAGGRAIVDQNGAARTPAHAEWLNINALTAIWFNTFPAHPINAADIDGITLGQDNSPECRFDVVGNLVSGIIDDGAVSHIARRAGNLLTAQAATGTDVSSTLENTFEDAANGDYRIRAGATARAVASPDMTAEKNALLATFAHLDAGALDHDINGRAMNWSGGQVGCAADYSPPGASVLWVTTPSFTGDPIVGETLVGGDGLFFAHPRPATTYQWQRSITGGLFAEDIPGETGADLVITTGLEGVLVRRLDTADGVSRATRWSPAILGAFPIGDPVVRAHAPYSGGSTDADILTPAWVSNGDATAIIVQFRADALAELSGVAATIGGQAATLLGVQRQSQRQVHVFAINSPPTGSITATVSVGTGETYQTAEVIVVDAAGASSLTDFVSGTGSSTGTTGAAEVTTAGETRMILAGLLLGGADDDDSASLIEVSGATELHEDDTGGTSDFADLTSSLAFIRAIDPRAYTTTFEWAVSGSNAAWAVQFQPPSAAPVGLGVPVALETEALSQAAFDTTARDTEAFTSSGEPVLVTVVVRDVSFGTDTTGTLTIQTDPGAVQSVAAVQLDEGGNPANAGRNQRQILPFLALAPPSGQVEAVFTPTGEAVSSSGIAVIELPRAGAVTDYAETEGNTASLSLTLAGCAVGEHIHAGYVRQFKTGDPADLVAVTGGVELIEAVTGSSENTDLHHAHAYHIVTQADVDAGGDVTITFAANTAASANSAMFICRVTPLS